MRANDGNCVDQIYFVYVVLSVPLLFVTPFQRRLCFSPPPSPALGAQLAVRSHESNSSTVSVVFIIISIPFVFSDFCNKRM